MYLFNRIRYKLYNEDNQLVSELMNNHKNEY